jgi:hypothetical protein
MALPSRLQVTETLLGVGSLGALGGAIAAIDETARVRMVEIVNGGFSHNLTVTGGHLHRWTSAGMEAARAFGADHTPLTIFVAVAAVLMILMLRP